MTTAVEVKALPLSIPLPTLLFLCTCYEPEVLNLPNYETLRREAVIFHNSGVKGNDMMAKRILRHDFGERLAIRFRDWIRAQMDPSEELEDGGASIEDYNEFYANNRMEEYKDAA
jgi:hypothetical protein